MNNSINFKVITDYKQAREIWEELSPHTVIDDEFDFRYSFIKYLDYKLYFIAGYLGNEVFGLLPLQLNTGKGLLPPYQALNPGKPFLEFFGGDDTDDNSIFVRSGYEQLKGEFLKQVPYLAFLAPLSEKLSYKKEAVLYENKYTIPLTFKNYEEFIDNSFTGESRGKMKRNLRNIYNRNMVEVLYNNYEDLELLFELNHKRFGEGSSFRFPYRREIFRDFLKMYQSEMITIVVNGKKEAVSYAIKYNDTYLDMNVGVNTEIRDLGKLLTMLQIDRAIQLGCTTFDAGKGDSGWKEQFKLDKTPQYLLPLEGFVPIPRFY